MRKVDRYLGDHLSETLRTQEPARQVSLSASHFYRAFKESYGTTPHMHIITIKYRFAQRLMLTTEHPLSQIVLVSGMADQSHLSKLFRRGVGDTPNAWRRRNLSDAPGEAGTRHLRASQQARRLRAAGVARRQPAGYGALNA
jgi:transcriptional regulator GlxA family with amidase domain